MKLFSLIKIFLPWVGYKIVFLFFPSFAMLAGVLSSLLSINSLKKGFVLEWGTFIFFSIGLFFSTVFHYPFLVDHLKLFISCFMILVSGVSLLINKPFTIQYAKEKIDKKYWDSFLFIRINQIMTGGFCLIFLSLLLLDLFRHRYPGMINGTLIWIIALTGKIIFIKNFPNWYRKRYMQRHRMTQDELQPNVYNPT